MRQSFDQIQHGGETVVGVVNEQGFTVATETRLVEGKANPIAYRCRTGDGMDEIRCDDASARPVGQTIRRKNKGIWNRTDRTIFVVIEAIVNPSKSTPIENVEKR